MDDDLTYVPIERDEEKAASQISGEEYYKERGEEDRIQDAEIIDETAIADIEAALDEELFSELDEEYYEGLDDEYLPDEEEDTMADSEKKELNLEGLDIREADSVEEAVEAIGKGKKKAYKFRKWYQKWWIYAIIAAVVFIASASFYLVSRAEYNEKMDAVADEVAMITAEFQNGSGETENTLEEELNFYTNLTHQAQELDKTYQQINRTYWWSKPSRSREAVGLVTLQETMNELSPMLSNLSVFMEQVTQVKNEVEGTEKAPGHLKRSLVLSESDGILEQDQSMIASTLEMCDALSDLPEAFTAGRENLREELIGLDAKIALTREYLIEVRKQEPEVEMYCSAARDFYQRDFTGHFAEDLNTAYSVLQRVDQIQQNIGAVNENAKYKTIQHYYGISDFALDDAGIRMLEDRGMLEAARTEVQSVADEDAALQQNPTDGGLVQEMLDNNHAHYENLQQIATPKEMETGKITYLNGLDVREHYLRAQLEYIAVLEVQNNELDKLDSLRAQYNSLREEVQEAGRKGDIETMFAKAAQMKDLEEDIADQRAVCEKAAADVTPKKEQASSLYQQYIGLTG